MISIEKNITLLKNFCPYQISFCPYQKKIKKIHPIKKTFVLVKRFVSMKAKFHCQKF